MDERLSILKLYPRKEDSSYCVYKEKWLKVSALVKPKEYIW